MMGGASIEGQKSLPSEMLERLSGRSISVLTVSADIDSYTENYLHRRKTVFYCSSFCLVLAVIVIGQKCLTIGVVHLEFKL